MPDSWSAILTYRHTWRGLSPVKSMQTKKKTMAITWLKVSPFSLCIFYSNAPGTVPIYAALCSLGPNAFDNWSGPWKHMLESFVFKVPQNSLFLLTWLSCWKPLLFVAHSEDYYITANREVLMYLLPWGYQDISNSAQEFIALQEEDRD